MYMACNRLVKQHPKLVQLLGTFSFGLSMGIAIVKLLCLFNLIDLNQKQYVYVDIEKVITSVNRSITKQVEKKQITDNQVTENLSLAKNKFNHLLASYIKQHNAVIFSSSKVIAGADNITDYFIGQTLEDIK